MHYSITPIGIIQSPYQEKFGIPRQPDLAPSAPLSLQLLPPFDQPDCVRGLEAFSHVWVTFVFHQTLARGWQPLVRPPRLGGNSKVGVFASRATHRPNGLGMSLLRLKSIDTQHGVTLHFHGGDLLDGTPVVDIKPYIPFVEAKPYAIGGFVDGPPTQLTVFWSDKARADLQAWPQAPAWLASLIDEVLAQDPRPAYQNDPTRRYGMRLADCDIQFNIDGQTVTLLEISPPAMNLSSQAKVEG